ncbi:S-adenosyl-L-methionine-dependent methyltransferase [Cladorrhinum samala]|uniref:type I protein arginine methyltransferase n=1 Tax=Cladorrhinum samala TaxID=585594 RepID=A0AAV9HLW1_9PEZI|nr:S-adenosyl-L-methionine-dependent methyltransferase [Cladorrhinum samala]
MVEAYPPSESSASSSNNSENGRDDAWLQADQDDGDDFGEQETVQVISLLDDKVFDDAVAMIKYCKDKYRFDFLAIRDNLGLDFYGQVKLINYVRQNVHEGREVKGESITAKDLEDDGLLKPVLEDDALILCLDELPAPGAQEKKDGKAVAGADGEAPAVDQLLQKNAQLQEELERLAQQFNNYRLAVQKTLDERWGEDDTKAAESSKAKGAVSGDEGEEGKKKGPEEATWYFESYAHNDIHETMLKDTIRTEAYRDFIYNNKNLFAGKTVLDIGCGTGILSMFCAKAGAARVLAVDNSNILDKARENIFNNGLDGVITCIKGKIEEVTLPVDKVDIIVSEWMGYCLLYEAMLPSVLFARDRYLKPDGLLVPSHTSMWIAPVSDEEYVTENMSFWRDVYGFDMKAMQEGTYTNARIEHMPTDAVCGTGTGFRMLDLHTCTPEDLVFTEKWQTTLSDKVESLDGFLVWFDTFFAEDRNEKIDASLTWKEWADAGRERVAFTTGPFFKQTHWKQGLLLVDKSKAKDIKVTPGQKLSGEIQYAIPEGHHRGLNIKVTWGAEGEEKQSQMWLCH